MHRHPSINMMRLLFTSHHHQLSLPTRIIRISSFQASRFSTSAPSHFATTLPAFNTMDVELSAPNGKKWTQPLGLFVNNEFVKSSNDQKLATINPA